MIKKLIIVVIGTIMLVVLASSGSNIERESIDWRKVLTNRFFVIKPRGVLKMFLETVVMHESKHHDSVLWILKVNRYKDTLNVTRYIFSVVLYDIIIGEPPPTYKFLDFPIKGKYIAWDSSIAIGVISMEYMNFLLVIPDSDNEWITDIVSIDDTPETKEFTIEWWAIPPIIETCSWLCIWEPLYGTFEITSGTYYPYHIYPKKHKR